MVLDSDRRLGPRTVTGPLDMAGNNILRTLEPLKTNDSGLRRAQYNRVRTYRPVLSLVSFTLVFIVTPGQGFGTSLLNSSDKVDARPAKLCDREAQSSPRFAILDPSIRA